MLNHIINHDYDNDDEIDFTNVENDRTAKKNKQRWEILQKSVYIKNKHRTKTSEKAFIIKEQINNKKRHISDKKDLIQTDILDYFRKVYR